MSASAPTKTTTCASCRNDFAYTPRFFDGKEVFTPPDCPECEEKERVFREKLAADRAREERRIVWSKLGLPFQSADTRTVISKLPCTRSEVVLRWSYGPKGVFCHGPTGAGKSRTVIELLRRLWVEEGREFNWIPWSVWQGELDGSPKFGTGLHSRKVAPLTKVPILAFDDVGKGRPNEGLLTAFFAVIDARTSAGLPTLLTTKFPLSKQPGSPFEARLALGSADAARDVSRRLAEHCFNAPFILNTP